MDNSNIKEIYCVLCNYKTTSNIDWLKHIETQKHMFYIFQIIIIASNTFYFTFYILLSNNFTFPIIVLSNSILFIGIIIIY